MNSDVTDPAGAWIDGPAGRLQVHIDEPQTSRPGAAVVCHPHPQYGGTMHNKVVHTLVRAFNLAGLPALRFNFRGVQDSEGTYDEGRGEVDDVLAAVHAARARWPQGPLWLAGFSFGAAAALRAAGDALPDGGLVTVAPPVGYFAARPLTGLPAAPWLLVQGDADDVVDPPEVLTWASRQQPEPVVHVLEGVGHFFHGHLPQLRSLVQTFVHEHSPA